MNEFQVRLRRAMLASGLRQADLAKKAEISDSKVSCYMSGRYKPNAETISKLAAALGVTPAWLVGEGPDDLPALSKKALERSVSDAPLPFKDNRVNVIGEVAAGVPIAAQEDIERRGEHHRVLLPEPLCQFLIRSNLFQLVPICTEKGSETPVFLQDNPTLKNIKKPRKHAVFDASARYCEWA